MIYPLAPWSEASYTAPILPDSCSQRACRSFQPLVFQAKDSISYSSGGQYHDHRDLHTAVQFGHAAVVYLRIRNMSGIPHPACLPIGHHSHVVSIHCRLHKVSAVIKNLLHHLPRELDFGWKRPWPLKKKPCCVVPSVATSSAAWGVPCPQPSPDSEQLRTVWAKDAVEFEDTRRKLRQHDAHMRAVNGINRMVTLPRCWSHPADVHGKTQGMGTH